MGRSWQQLKYRGPDEQHRVDVVGDDGDVIHVHAYSGDVVNVRDDVAAFLLEHEPGQWVDPDQIVYGDEGSEAMGTVQYIGAQNPHSETVQVNGYQQLIVSAAPGETLTLPDAVCSYLVGVEPNWWTPANGWSPPAANPSTLAQVKVYAAYSQQYQNTLIVCDATAGGSFDVSLLDATVFGGVTTTVKNVGTANTVTLVPVAGQVLDSAFSAVLNPGDSLTLVSDGSTTWRVSYGTQLPTLVESASNWVDDNGSPVLEMTGTTAPLHIATGITADSTGPGTGTDNFAVLQALINNTNGTSPELPDGVIAVNSPLVMSNAGQILRGLYGAQFTSTSNNYGTTLVPGPAFADPVIATDSAGGTVTTGTTWLQWINGTVETVQTYVYTTNAGSLPAAFKIGQLVYFSGGTASASSICEILDVTATTLILGPGCTTGTVATLTSKWGALIVMTNGFSGLQGLTVQLGTTNLARCVAGMVGDCHLENVNAYGGTLAPIDIVGNRWRIKGQVRSERNANSGTFAPMVGPYAFRASGQDHFYPGVLATNNGTTALGEKFNSSGDGVTRGWCGHISQLTGGGPTPGGPALQFSHNPPAYGNVSHLQLNPGSSGAWGSCLIHSMDSQQGGGQGMVLSDVSINPSTSMPTGIPVVVEESNDASSRGGVVIDGMNVENYLTGPPNPYSELMLLVNGKSTSSALFDVFSQSAYAWSAIFSGGAARAKNIIQQNTPMDGDQTVIPSTTSLTAGSSSVVATSSTLPPGVYKVAGQATLTGATNVQRFDVYLTSSDGSASGLTGSIEASAANLSRSGGPRPALVTLPDGGTISLNVLPNSAMTGTLSTLITDSSGGNADITYLTVERLR